MSNEKEDSPIVLVTGSGRGLGRGIAVELAKNGFSVAVHYGSSSVGAQETIALCEEVKQNESQVFECFQADLSDEVSRKSLIPSIIKKLGFIDSLINNAGITEPNRRDCLEATEEDYDTVMNINLKAPYFLTQEVANLMIQQGKSDRITHYQIINISSISSDTVSTNRGAYCLSKAALSMATQIWASRLADHNILVNDLKPGIMVSDMTAGAKDKYDDILKDGQLVPLARWGLGEDVGKAAASILLGNFPFTTGHVIPIDGGFHIKRL